MVKKKPHAPPMYLYDFYFASLTFFAQFSTQTTTCTSIAIVLLIPLVQAQLGVNFASVYDLKVSAGNEMQRTETIYTPGAMEKNIKGVLVLCPGIWVPENRASGDLIHTVIGGSKTASECRGKPGQWCIAPSVPLVRGRKAGFQLIARYRYVMHGVTRADREPKQYPVEPDGKIKIIYEKRRMGPAGIKQLSTC